jgi:hypothetical protein
MREKTGENRALDLWKNVPRIAHESFRRNKHTPFNTDLQQSLNHRLVGSPNSDRVRRIVQDWFCTEATETYTHNNKPTILAPIYVHYVLNWGLFAWLINLCLWVIYEPYKCLHCQVVPKTILTVCLVLSKCPHTCLPTWQQTKINAKFLWLLPTPSTYYSQLERSESTYILTNYCDTVRTYYRHHEWVWLYDTIYPQVALWTYLPTQISNLPTYCLNKLFWILLSRVWHTVRNFVFWYHLVLNHGNNSIEREAYKSRLDWMIAEDVEQPTESDRSGKCGVAGKCSNPNLPLHVRCTGEGCDTFVHRTCAVQVQIGCDEWFREHSRAQGLFFQQAQTSE